MLSCLLLQAIWRGYVARKQLEIELRSSWDQLYAPGGTVSAE